MTKPASFSFDGISVQFQQGQSLAAALTDAGIRDFRETRSGAERGMFCGMGVCQDCLLEVDGQPSLRACMTGAVDGMIVHRQGARARWDGAAPESAQDTPRPLRRIAPDVLVVGGGAGGLNAARAAARAGASTVLLDERKVGGGQYFKQTASDLDKPAIDFQQRRGALLLKSAKEAGVEILTEAEVWGVFGGPEVCADVNGTSLIALPKRLIIATGAYERPVLVPGWTLPGVMTTGAAQTLWRTYRALPGKRVAIVGSGPLNLQVGLELKSGGADVRLVAETAPPAWLQPLTALSMFGADFRLALSGAKMVYALARGPGQLLFRTWLERIEQTENGLNVFVRSKGSKLDPIEVDAVCMNGGFQPQNEILRLLGADMVYDQQFDQLRPIRSQSMETSIQGVFAVGDCCGLGGAPAAELEGQIAGAASATDHETAPRSSKRILEKIAHRRRFQSLLWKLYDAQAQTLESLPSDTIVCRCEEVTRADIEGALSDDMMDIGSLKRATRLGMGPCQGRYCAPIVAPFLAQNRGETVDDLAFFAPRIPIKPVSIETLAALDESDRETKEQP